MVKYVLELVCSPKGEQFKVLKFILNYTTSHLHFQCAKYHMNVTLNYAWMQGIITENCGRWLKWSNCSYISSFTPLMSIKPQTLFGNPTCFLRLQLIHRWLWHTHIQAFLAVGLGLHVFGKVPFEKRVFSITQNTKVTSFCDKNTNTEELWCSWMGCV